MSNTIQSAVTVGVSYAKETNWGEQATGEYRRLERVSGLFSLTKDTYSSERIRSDRNVVYSRHGVRGAEGTFNDELAIGSHDDFLEAALFGEWTAGASVQESMVCDSASSTITSASGDFSAFSVGDVVDVHTDDWTERYRVDAISEDADVLTVGVVSFDDPPLSDFSGQTLVEVVGSKLKNGVKRTSFTVRQHFPDVAGDAFQVATGVLVDSVDLELPPTGLGTAAYNFTGRNLVVSGQDPASSVVDPVEGDLLAAVNGACYLDGQKVALLTSLSLSLANNISGDPVVGSNFRPRLFEGRCVVTGSLTAYMEDQGFIKAFDDESEISIDAILLSSDKMDFLRFYGPRVKVNSASVTADGEGGATVQCDLEFLMDHKEQAALLLQRSNG